jgi:hypothetical protein
MKYLILVLMIWTTLGACNKKISTKVYKYSFNKFYNGSLNINNLSAIATVTEVDSGISVEVKLIGADPNIVYPTHIHVKDDTQPYGFHGFPIIGVHEVHNGHATSNFSKEYNFITFTETFKGYLLIHDPRNSNDTTTHVVFGKIGAW